jgi:hypothetical protein
MLKRIIGAAIGASVAKKNPAAGGVTGALLASAVPFVLSRISLPAMILLGVGGYAARRYIERRGQQATPEPPPPPPPVQP